MLCPVSWDYSQCGRQRASVRTGVRVSVRSTPRDSIAEPEGGMWLPAVVVKNVDKTWVHIPAM